MKLDKYIQQVGDETAAKLFGFKLRTIASYRRRERLPSPRAARVIIDKTHGLIKWEDIYGAEG